MRCSTTGINDHAGASLKGAERIALEDSYFVDKKLLPERGLTPESSLRALGFPTNMSTVLLLSAERWAGSRTSVR